uniref:EamA domain-containing protein n=1 Tax=Meloidogyne hapla TaxID=6305 RepID=A0A1I8BJP8_MELHA
MSRLSTSKNSINSTIFLRVLSAIFYAISSITVIFVNKILLTNYRVIPTFGVKFSVFLMIFGSAIAAM